MAEIGHGLDASARANLVREDVAGALAALARDRERWGPGEEDRPRHDFVAMNPPYQRSLGTPTSEGRDANVANVFQHFYDLSLDLGEHSSLVMPGGRWMQRTTRCNRMADRIFSTAHSVDWFPHGEERQVEPLFPGVAIPDGVAMVEADRGDLGPNVVLNGVAIGRPMGDQIVPLSAEGIGVTSTIFSTPRNNLNARRSSVNAFGLPGTLVAESPGLVCTLGEGPGNLVNPIRAHLGNATPGKMKRVEPYWLSRNSVDWTPGRERLYRSWKVLSSQGQVGKRPATTTYRIVENNCVVGASWMMVGTFDTRVEALNYLAYLNTDLARFLLEEGRGGKSARWGTFVPDLGDYTARNPHIRWDRPLDRQLHRLFGLTEAQVATVTSRARLLTGPWRAQR